MTTLAFQYFEARPVIRGADEDCVSFIDEDHFNREVSRRRDAGETIETFWSLYGIDADGLSHAVSDYTAKASIFEVLQAILAPMARARDLIDSARADEASSLLTDFVAQCSNDERI